jgi:diguanylate cyclase (GGDEF)-like protein
MMPRLRAFLLLLLLLGTAGHAFAAEPVRLDDTQRRVEAWSAVEILPDPRRELDWAGALLAIERFEAPKSAHATLGLRKEPVWVRIPVQVAADGRARWLLDIDYAVLNRIDVHLLRDGQLVQRARLGNLQPYAERPVASRSHAVLLDLQPGARHELLLRVETLGGMILPIAFTRLTDFHSRAQDEMLLQGLLTGLGLCLVLYTLAQWVSTREPLFLKYALLTFGSLMFSVVQFGLGGMYLWRDQLWLEQHAAGLAALLAAACTFLFVEEVLRGPDVSRYFSRVMFGGAAALGLTALLYATDLIHVHVVSMVIGTLGLMPALMGLPGAVRRARRGDPIGWYFLVAWLGYFVSTATMVGVIKGHLDANAWTLHSFQAGATLDMVLFLRVLGLRMKSLHAAAMHAVRERDVFVSMAYTDALTGLPNRRGLDTRLTAAMTDCAPDRLLAVYMLDLDGFKQVNDRWGHDIGDELLVAVGQRLQSNLRGSDVVARLGGDEFVVTAAGLADEGQARDLGAKLVEAFRTPFALSGERRIEVGLTIGYVLVPLDGLDPVSLLRQADAAMYAGKQRGKGCCVRRPAVAGYAGSV